MLTQAYLKEHFYYCEKTGNLIRIKYVPPHGKIGDIAGNISVVGYRQIKVCQKVYYAHRLVWLYNYGVWPAHTIDHINGDKLDNRLSNIRDVTLDINCQGFKQQRTDNTSGYTGVVYIKTNGKFRATLGKNNKNIFLGEYTNPVDAHNAYLEAKAKNQSLHLL